MSRKGIFSCVKTEGGLLPQDLLERIHNGDKNLQGTKESTYHLDAHVRSGDAVSQCWSRLTAAWRAFQDARAKEPEGSAATALTRERWLLPLFDTLGYGRLPRGSAIQLDGRSFAISHKSAHPVPIHLLGAGIPLDKRQKGVAGAALSSPHGLVQDFLNRSDDHLWGFLSNGLQLRVLRDHFSLTQQAYVEFDLEAMMEGEQFSDFFLLWSVCHQSRVENEKPEECWLEVWANTSREEGVRALDKLRDGVEKSIEALGSGFLLHKSNTALRDALEDGSLDKQDYYRQLLRLVYRLIFLFVAEDRRTSDGIPYLLDPDATDEAKARFLDYYSTHRYRDLADKRRGGPHGDLWRGMKLVMEKLYDGCPDLALPALGSQLWGPKACPWLMKSECSNEYFLEALRRLAFTEEDKRRTPVNWRNMGAEELGSVYEGLLELHPRINKESDRETFVLDTAAGHDRKTTGSYYTPTSLVDCLLDSALDPVLDEACRKPNAEEAILDLTVCDPACGSGHFLVAAARRIAKRLAAVRSGDDEPSPVDVQAALRDVVGHCIYGVDLNPMAVELCKVSLWMEAIEPGRPLSFLDAHIQCGNALLGATPALMSRGIPDDAFKPIEGDDKEVAKQLKKQNREDRKTGQATLFSMFVSEPSQEYNSVASQAEAVEGADDATIESLRKKASAWERLTASPKFQQEKFLADAWCSAFIWPKQPGDLQNAAITQSVWRRMQEGAEVPNTTRGVVTETAADYRFFHWHLAFPQVFGGAKSTIEEDDTTGWTGGFDCVLGNPPWEAADLMKVEFFSTLLPDVASAATTNQRNAIIDGAVQADPKLSIAWLHAQRASQGERHVVTTFGHLPLTSGGKYNTYRSFAELGTLLVRPSGKSGLIVKSGIINAQANQRFFSSLLDSGRVDSAFDFINTKPLFSDVVGNERFCNLTVSGMPRGSDHRARFSFGLTDPVEATDARAIHISSAAVAVINPNDRSIPPVLSERDLRLLVAAHNAAPVLLNGPLKASPHHVRYRRGHLNSSTNSGLFKANTYETIADRLTESPDQEGWTSDLKPLAEGKLIASHNHRFGTFRGIPPKRRFGKKAQPNRPSLEDLQNPSFRPIPRFWLEATDAEVLFEKSGWHRDWVLTFRHVCRAIVDARTAQFCIAPLDVYSDSCAFVLMESSAQDAAASALTISAVMNSFMGDYILRQKLYGPALTKAILLQLPVPSLDQLRRARFLGDGERFVVERMFELTYTTWSLDAFATDFGWERGPLKWDAARRTILRDELDAAMFHVFGVARADVEYVLECFPIVQRRDEKRFGDFRTKLRILELYDDFQRAIDTGEPYQTLLDPPPADPRCAHPESTRPDWAKEEA